MARCNLTKSLCKAQIPAVRLGDWQPSKGGMWRLSSGEGWRGWGEKAAREDEMGQLLTERHPRRHWREGGGSSAHWCPNCIKKCWDAIFSCNDTYQGCDAWAEREYLNAPLACGAQRSRYLANLVPDFFFYSFIPINKRLGFIINHNP